MATLLALARFLGCWTIFVSIGRVADDGGGQTIQVGRLLGLLGHS
jgi:hypothetical protein